MTKPFVTCAAILAALLALPAGADAQTGGQLGGQGNRGGGARPVEDAKQDLGLSAALDVRAGGFVRRAVGRVDLAGADLDGRMQDLLQRFGPAFGVVDDVAMGAPHVLHENTDGELVVRVPQLVHGFEVMGHGLVTRMDPSGRARVIHGVVSADAARLQPPMIDRTVCMASVWSHLAAQGLGPDELRGQPVIHDVVRVRQGGPMLLYRVETVVAASLTPMVIEVSAIDGSIVSSFEHRIHGGGKGKLPWNGQVLEFGLTNGKGYFYKGIKEAVNSASKSSGLKGLINETLVSAVAEDGMLVGRWAHVFDDTGIYLVSEPYEFPFLDDSLTLIGGMISEFELFDHVNTFHWLNRTGAFLDKALKGHDADLSLPAIVNFSDGGLGYANAFYSPVDLDGPGGYDPGYFVFGDFDNVTGDVMDDLSRDPTIVAHEYTHGMVDKEGVPWGDGDLDTPARAVNEAVADFGSASMFNDPRIGPAFMNHSADDLVGLDGESLRHLESPVTMPDDLWDVVGATTLMPEEHEAGVIFGAALWRVRAGLKKTAQTLVFGTMHDWPQSNAEAGFPLVTPANAEDAYRAFYFMCFEAMMDELMLDGAKKGGKNAAKVLGAFLTHGITGTSPSTMWRFEDVAGGANLKWTGAFLGSIDEHAFEVTLVAGQEIGVGINGDKKDLTQVDFAFDDGPGDFTYQKEAKIGANGLSKKQAKILVNNSGTYTLTLTNPGSGGGRYKTSVKIKKAPTP